MMLLCGWKFQGHALQMVQLHRFFLIQVLNVRFSRVTKLLSVSD